MTKKTATPVREGGIVSCQLRRKGRNGKRRIREFQAPQGANSTGLAGSIQDVMAKSEVVLAAQSIVEKLQSIAEDLSTVEAKDIMPLLDSLTDAFGPQVADNFNNIATEQIRQLITSVQAAKSALDKEILRMKRGIEGGDTSDLGMDLDDGGDEAPEAPMDGEEPPLEPAPGSEPAVGSAPGLPEVPTDNMGNAEDDALSSGSFAGRPRKESAQRRGKKLNEFFDDSAFDSGPTFSDGMQPRAKPKTPQPAIDLHPHHSEDYDANMHNIGEFHGRAGEMARNIGSMIDNEALTGDQRMKLSNVLSHFAGFAHDPSHWSHAEMKLKSALKGAHLTDVSNPTVEEIVDELRKLAHFLTFKHAGIVENAIKSLKCSTDPDALVLRTFRLKLVETRDAQMAAIRTARTFAIDVEDVVAVVREAAEKKKPCPKCGEFHAVGGKCPGKKKVKEAGKKSWNFDKGSKDDKKSKKDNKEPVSEISLPWKKKKPSEPKRDNFIDNPRGTTYSYSGQVNPKARTKPADWTRRWQTPVGEGKEVDEEHIGFKKLERSLSHKKGIKDPAAVAATIGREKYGKAGMARKAAAGRHHVGESVLDEFQMHTPDSAKGMFSGDNTAELKKRKTRDKASVANANEHGKGHAEKSKDLKRVNFAIRAKKEGGNKGKWHKKVSEDVMPNQTPNQSPIFPVGAGATNSQYMNSNAMAGSNMTNTSGEAVPAAGGPAVNPSTRKPMSPMDRRNMQANQRSDQEGTGIQAPSSGRQFGDKSEATMVPPGEVEAGGQVPPTNMPKRIPVQQVKQSGIPQQPRR